MNEQTTSPRVAQNPNDQGFYDDHEDGEYEGENGTIHDEDGEYGDQEGDEDDMMDKISSSPSIDDGKYTLPSVWPTREASLSSSPPPSVLESSSPFTSTPDHVPLFWRPENHHQEGGYNPTMMKKKWSRKWITKTILMMILTPFNLLMIHVSLIRVGVANAYEI